MRNSIKGIKYATLPMAIALVTQGFSVSADEVQAEKSIEKIAVVGRTTNVEITPEQLAKYQANDLADVFRFTPSVEVGGSLGVAQKIYVRGLEDTLLNVTVDGAPQTSTLFHHIGRVSVEPELLRQVDVQAGAGEATSGAGAIGGAIRFKTKKADDLLKPEQQFGGLIKASYFSNDGHKESASVYGKVADKVGVLASYVNVKRNNMEDGNGQKIPGTASDQSLAFVKLNAELTDEQELTVSYERRKESGEFGKQPNWSPIQGDPLYAAKGVRETLVLNHTFYRGDLINLETTLYDTKSSFERELFTWRANIESKGFDIRNTSLLGSHSVAYGVEYRNDEIRGQSFGDFGGVYLEKGTVTGLYIQDHWQMLDNLLVSFGARFDKYELDHTGISPTWIKVDGVWIIETNDSGAPITTDNMFSIDTQDGISQNIGIEYGITSELTFSAGYAEAFRGRQIADGFTIGELTFNPNLEAENVRNKELGLEYKNDALFLKASTYLSEINDVVFDKFKGREGVLFENIGTLESHGFEIVAGYQGSNFDVVASYNHNTVELNDAPFVLPDASTDTGFSTVILNNVDLEAYEYGGLGNAGGDSWNIHFNYEISAQLELGWNFNYVESDNAIDVFYRSMELGWVDDISQVSKPGYRVHDLYVNYTPIKDVVIDLSVYNIFNETYRSHGSVADYGHFAGYDAVVGINEAGRDIRLSVSYQF